MKWLVTGGCGFIGTRLIETILKNNRNYVRVLDNLSTGTREQLGSITSFEEIELSELSENPGQVQLLVGDILDKDLAEAVSNSIDTIVHLAANTGVGPSVEDPRNDCMHNVIGLLNMQIRRINKVKRFVFASSGAPIGNTDPPIHEELPAHPVSPYGASKLAGEDIVQHTNTPMTLTLLLFVSAMFTGQDPPTKIVWWQNFCERQFKVTP